jgi:hypothetical protein
MFLYVSFTLMCPFHSVVHTSFRAELCNFILWFGLHEEERNAQTLKTDSEHFIICYVINSNSIRDLDSVFEI